jgi:hypothetical protein
MAIKKTVPTSRDGAVVLSVKAKTLFNLSNEILK